MKLLKNLALLFASVSIMSCGSDDDSSAPSFELTAETIVGSYELTSVSGQDEVYATTPDGDLTLFSSSTVEGSTYGTQLVLSSDLTFTASNEFVENYVITGVEGDSTEDSDAISFNDQGTYVLDIEENTIIFTLTSSGDNDVVFEGLFNIDAIDEDGLIINKIIEGVEASERDYEFERIFEEE